MRNFTLICCLMGLLLGVKESSQLQCYQFLKQDEGTETCKHTLTHTVNTSDPSNPHQISYNYSKLHPEAQNLTGRDLTHCLILQYMSKDDEAGCDSGFFCDNVLLQANPDSAHLVRYLGSFAYLFCCTTDNCTGKEKLENIRKNPPPLPCIQNNCTGHGMIVRKRLTSKPFYQDLPVYSCDDQNVCSTNQLTTNQCKNITDFDGVPGDITEVCCCDTLSCGSEADSAPDSPSAPCATPQSSSQPPSNSTPLGPMPPTSTGQDNTKWKFVAGIVGGLLMLLLLLLLLAIIIKKYKAYKQGPVTYSYNQLTADLAEERETEDENMIVA